MKDMYYELIPRYSSRQSFYGKAHINEYYYDDKKIIDLISYTTKVASIEYLYNDKKDVKQIIYKYLGHYSATTTTHQREFFLQHGLNEEQFKKIVKNDSLVIEINN